MLPTVVVEIVLGIVIGPEVLDLAEVDSYIRFLSNFGLALLFFFAGLEVIERRVVRSSVVRGAAGWAVSLAIGLSVGALLSEAGVDAEWWLLGVALSTTALGTLVPILIDAGLLSTLLGSAVLGAGIAGEFWPIVVISIFLTGAYGAIEEALLLLAFGALVALAAATATRARPPRLLRVLQETVHTTGQAAVRASIFVLGASSCSRTTSASISSSVHSLRGSSSVSPSTRRKVRRCGCGWRESASGSSSRSTSSLPG